MEIKLIKSTFFNEEYTKEKLCNFIMSSKQLSMGEQCKSFEKNFSKWQGRNFSTLVNSGSSANLILIQSLLNLGLINKNDNIGFSGITWATNTMPLIQLGLNPIPIDVNLNTFNCSLLDIENSHKKYNLKMIFITNLLGFSDEIDKISTYCIENNIILIEDNCESLGSEYKGIKLGNFGLASTFSFFVGHHMSSIEGGMVCTNNIELNNELIKVRAHGWDRNLEQKEQYNLRNKFNITDFYSKYTFYDLGFNVRPTEITGFLGNLQLNFLDEIVRIRESNFNKLFDCIKNNSDFYKLDILVSKNSNFAFPLICKNKEIFDKYINIFNEKNIEIRPIVGGLISKQPFFLKYNNENYDLPNSELIHNFGFYFGNNPEMTNDEINYIINTFK